MSILLNISLDFLNEQLWYRVLLTCLATFAINLPFGYWRGGLKKLSLWWFVAIHSPVPAVVFIRKLNDLQLTWKLAPFLLGAYFLGQFAGRKFYAKKPWKKTT